MRCTEGRPPRPFERIFLRRSRNATFLSSRSATSPPWSPIPCGGFYRPDEALTWPKHALEAVWALHSGRSRPHLVRTGKTFQEWRRMRSASPEKISPGRGATPQARKSPGHTRSSPAPAGGRPPSCEGPNPYQGSRHRGAHRRERAGAGPYLRLDFNDCGHQPAAANTGAAQSSSETSFSGTQASPTESALPLTVGSSPKSGDRADNENEGSSRKRWKPPCRCHEIPAQHQWWFKAWPSPHGLPACHSGPIRRRLARMST